MRNRVGIGGTLLAVVLPWALVWLERPTAPVPEWCEVPYHVDNEGAQVASIAATIHARFRPDGSSSATLIGSVTVAGKPYRIHRLSELTWRRQGDFMLSTTHSVRTRAEDTVPGALAPHVLLSMAKEGHSDYYQMHPLPNGDQMIYFAGLPRLYCHT